jgi:hypothetical protein
MLKKRDIFLYMYDYGTLKLDEVILKSGVGEKREANGGDISNQGSIYVYVEMSQ